MSNLDTHLEKLEALLDRFKASGITNHIAGEDRPGGLGTFDNISPVDTSHICEVARSGTADIDAAANAAADAFADWRDLPATQRRKF